MSNLLLKFALALTITAASLPATLAEDVPDYLKCGAAGDACQPKEWQDYSAAAAKAFPDWPEVGYRMYAGECMNASKKIKKLCLEQPVKAAHELGLDQ